MSDIAYVGVDRQVYLVPSEGGESTALTMDLSANPLLIWGQPALERSAWSWPTWSPDGRRVACFELPDGDDVSGPARVIVIEDDGVQQRVLAELRGHIPIYLSWRADGAGVAILLQNEEELVLAYVSLAEPGKVRYLEQGVPLFFAWAPDSRSILIHSGTARQPGAGRLVLRDTEGQRPDEVLPLTPGNYCAPVLVGDRVVHAIRDNEQNRLVVTDLSGGSLKRLCDFEGLGAILPIPGRDQVLFAIAPEGEGNPYEGVSIIDLDSGEIRQLSDEPCLAFLWSAATDELIYVQVDHDDNCLIWHRKRAGEAPSALDRFWPSRELLFYLHFFDQFTLSHSLISPDGRHLLFAGHGIGADEGVNGPPRLLMKDIASASPMTEIALGAFGCFKA